VPALGRVLSDADATVRLEAVRALHRFKSAAADIAPMLVRALEDDSIDVVAHATMFLALDLRREPDRLVPALVRGLKSERPLARVQARWILGTLGPSEEKAVPALERLCEDVDESVRDAAAEALAKIREEKQEDG
jgi:HEAT repeat protein